MSDGSETNFKFEYLLWLTDIDLARLISCVPDRTLYESLLKCNPLVRHRVLSQISSIRRDCPVPRKWTEMTRANPT